MTRKPIPKKIREQVYKKYNGHCAYFGERFKRIGLLIRS
jgi:hypothetical protein